MNKYINNNNHTQYNQVDLNKDLHILEVIKTFNINTCINMQKTKNH